MNPRIASACPCPRSRSLKSDVTWRAKLFGRGEVKTCILPVDPLVGEVMSQGRIDPPHASSGSWTNAPPIAVRTGGAPAVEVAVRGLGSHTHSCWLAEPDRNYFSIVQRKVFTPNDFSSLAGPQERVLNFQDHYQQIAKPFQWIFARQNLADLLAKLGHRSLRMSLDETLEYVTVIPSQSTQ